MLPAGGAKGSGLALVFQCLTSLMANSPLIAPVLRGGAREHRQNSVVAAIDIGFFIGLGEYRELLDETIDELKALPKAEGHEEILMPGEPEQRLLETRARDGIPLPPGTVEKLRETARRLDLAPPLS